LSPRHQADPNRPRVTATFTPGLNSRRLTGVKRCRTAFFKSRSGFVEKRESGARRGVCEQRSLPLERPGCSSGRFVTVTTAWSQPSTELHAACQRWVQGGEGFPGKACPGAGKGVSGHQEGFGRLRADGACPECRGRRGATSIGMTWARGPALARHVKADSRGQLCRGGLRPRGWGEEHHLRCSKPRPIRTPIGLRWACRDSILVLTDDAVLLAHKSQAQKIKDLVRKLGDHPRLKQLV